MILRAALLLAAARLFAQQPITGVAPNWDTPALFQEIAAQSARLQPLLRQIKPAEWLSKGAPQSYVDLGNEILKENQALPDAAQAASKTPDRLADSLRLLLAVQKIQASLTPLLAGVREYQNPALAELIAGTEDEGQPARDAFAQRVLDLATEREHQFDVADHEAQRCRELLSKSPDGRSVKSK